MKRKYKSEQDKLEDRIAISLILFSVVMLAFVGYLVFHRATNPCIIRTAKVLSMEPNPDNIYGTITIRHWHANIATYRDTKSGEVWTDYATNEVANDYPTGSTKPYQSCDSPF